MAIFCVSVALCTLVDFDRRFRGSYCLDHQGHECFRSAYCLHDQDRRERRSSSTRLLGATTQKTSSYSSP
jgi:hypothetical protein